MNKPDFSVLMCTYLKDESRQLELAIQSIYENTLQPKEVVLIIDGDIKDCSQKIIDNFRNKKGLIYFKNKKNIGLAKSLNFGLTKITTEWVARADADDINLKYRFEKQINFLKKNDKLDLFGSAIKEISNEGDTIRHSPLSENEIIKYVKKRNPFNHMTVFFKLKKIVELGGYPNLSKMQDYALWALLINKKCKVKNMSDVLVHVNGGSKLIKRRGGLSYTMSEIKLQYYLYNNRLKKLHYAIFDGLIRSSVFLLPFSIRKIIYQKILR